MNPPTSLRIGFDLPFAVEVRTSPVRQSLLVEVHCARTLNEEDLRRLEAHIQVFVAAAMYGMGAGASTTPRFATTFDISRLLQVEDRYPTSESASYEAVGVAIDLAYLPVLFHKLYCLTYYFVPITKVLVQAPVADLAPQSIHIIRGSQSDLPEVFPRLPFRYEADLETYSQSLTLTVGFEKEPDGHVLSILKDACYTWVAQCLQGGFISPTCGPENFFLVPDEDFLILGNEVEWGLDKVQIDPRALHSLTNFLIAFSDHVARVTHFLLE